MSDDKGVRCPHCSVTIHVESQRADASMAPWSMETAKCPACSNYIVWLRSGYMKANRGWVTIVPQFRAYPAGESRPVAPEVPSPIAEDFTEACAVLRFSPKASAALSRRCLQNIFHQVGIKKKDLHTEIESAIASPGFPTYIAEMLHTVRQVGNVAAHPQKEQATGMIVPVEEGEAELLLDVLEDLFDHYFVKPAANAKRKAAITAKLAAAKGQAPPPAPSP